MEPLLALSDASRTTAGVLLLAVVTIEYGGTFLLRVVRGGVPMTPFQQSFARAGHAHAGVLVILALVCQLLVDATTLTGVWQSVGRSGVAVAAILMSAGFFLSSIGRDRHSPNRLIVLVWLGAASLASGVVTLGVGLLAT
jgi:drug/metabolite transporter superfamily protein YnfA